MQPTKDEFKKILTEIIGKQAVILGPQMAVLKARAVPGLQVSDSGEVTDVQGDESMALQKLIDEYVSLSGEIVKNAVNSVFAKYPTLMEKK